MRTQYAKKFNHDPIAHDYDVDVADESSPIRQGYEELLRWAGENASTEKTILDLGCGTGNTTNAVENYRHVFCVDISENMLDMARQKLRDRKDITYIKADLLEVFEQPDRLANVDLVISTYAIHHLTQPEKHILFAHAYGLLPPGGQIIFGDLMFENEACETALRQKYPHLIKDFDDEFFWNVKNDAAKLQNIGFDISIKRFSDLSWGISGIKPPAV